MDLSQVVDIVQILGTLVVVYGLWLGLKQFRLLRNQRRDLAIMECSRSFEDKEFTEAYRLLTSLEPGLTREQINLLGEEYELAALRTGMKFEAIGLLVFKGVVPIDAMEDLVGGAALTLWDVLEKWVEETREARSHPTFLEWYQWLKDQIIKRKKVKRLPAFQKYQEWNAPKN